MAAAVCAGSALGVGAASAAGSAADLDRDFDARVALTANRPVAPAPAQLVAAAALRRRLPELAVTYDPATGAARTLWNRAGYLTAPAPGREPVEIARELVAGHLDLLGLEPADLAGAEVTDVVPSVVTGATHLYLRQTHRGLPVVNGQLQVHVDRDGRVIAVANGFLPRLGSAAAGVDVDRPPFDAAAAVARAADHLGVELAAAPVEPRLAWLPIRRGEVRLVWSFALATADGAHDFELTVDAATGAVWTRVDRVHSAAYRVYPRPVESPAHTSPPPPADARLLVADPQDAVASPFGWHDTDGMAGAEFTIHRGNNVHAYEDSDADNMPPAVEPDCGARLDCDFPIDLSMAPSAYRAASVTNVFYWTNLVHDVQYRYGFDEPAGNFQVNNYGHGGLGGDDFRAEVQDGQATCSANVGIPPDGSRPRMDLGSCTLATPARDAALDSGVVVHELGHGISLRQVGGPSNVSCLANAQQPGEGWSDWFALAYTAEPGDAGTDPRTLGTWFAGQPPDGPGIRQLPYSTDEAVNDWTYESIITGGNHFNVGSRWAQALWEVYWALVDRHGFDPDLNDAVDQMGDAGNQRAMLYVNEGLKLTACGPTFLDARDGVLLAALIYHDGEDECLLWGAFAAFGLGADASTPGPNSTQATNGFAVPAFCQEIFADGFESGDTSAWSATVP